MSLTATPRALTYGHTTAVSGTVSTGQANQKVDILAQPCGENAAKVVTTATTTTGGAYTYTAQPALQTSYQARYKPATGPTITTTAVSVSVRPMVTLKTLARGKFSTQVSAAQSFVGKAVAFQRYVTLRHRWTTVKTVFLGTRAAAATPLAGTTVSSVTFRAKLRSALRVRAVLRSGQTAPCYLRREERDDPKLILLAKVLGRSPGDLVPCGGTFGIEGIRHAVAEVENLIASATAMAILQAVTYCWRESFEDDGTVVVLCVA